jgi:signal transduction histidine kinase
MLKIMIERPPLQNFVHWGNIAGAFGLGGMELDMERFHLKVTFVFIVTILLPSFLLCFFALQAVNYQRKQQAQTNRTRTQKGVELLNDSIFESFDRSRQSLVDLLEKGRLSVRSLRGYFKGLRDLEQENGMLSDLFVMDRDLKLQYPIQNSSGLDQEIKNIYPTHFKNSFRFMGGAMGALQGHDRNASELFAEIKREFESGAQTSAINKLEQLMDDPDPRVHLSATLEAARIRFTLGQVPTSIILLDRHRQADTSILGPLNLAGHPVAATIRIELAMVYDSVGKQNMVSDTVKNLVEDMAKRAALISRDTLEQINNKALLNLELNERTFRPVFNARQRLEEQADLDPIFRRDLEDYLRDLIAKRSKLRATDDESTLSPAKASASLKQMAASYTKHRIRNDIQIILYAPIYNISGDLLGICGYRFQLSSFVQDRLEPAITQQNFREPDARWLATNPPYDSKASKPKLDEEPVPFVRRLRSPLDHIELRAYQKKVTEAIRLANQEARLYAWVILVCICVVTVGVFTTVLTVRREARASELKTDFVANVTHELKTPLTSIRLFIETLELGHVANDEERDECLAIMARETERLTRLIDRLLAFSKLDKKAWKFRLTYEEPADLIHEALELYRNQRGHQGVEVAVESLQSPKVAVDREAMIEVIYNLIHNAHKYSPAADREIRVIVAERRRDIAISVVDNGVGVPRRDRRRIFRKFERGLYAERAQIQGSGIGLTLARSIVQGHGGELSYAPNKPKGSRFVITLPK